MTPRTEADEVGLAAGATVGRYVIAGRVGAGGGGTVYAAYDSVLDRRVALKLLRGAVTGHAATAHPDWARMVREARMLARLNDPRVVTVYDVGEVDGRTYLAMEFVEGSDLSRWLARHRGPDATDPRPLAAALDLLIPAGHGLAAAHAAKVVHGDFKPANVMVDENGAAKVTDFGIARLGQNPAADADDSLTDGQIEDADDPAHITRTRTTTVGGRLAGTPAYMAPEQFDGQPADVLTDVYAFSTTLFEAAYGALPFPGNTVPRLVAQKVDGRPQRPPGIRLPTWLEKVLQRGLSAEREDRYPDVTSLLADLERGRRRPRRRMLAASFVVGAGAAIAASVWLAQPNALCDDTEHGPLWTQEDRTAVKAAFEGTEHPAAVETWERVDSKLDRYAKTWKSSYDKACAATDRLIESSLAERAFSCLRRRRVQMRALVDVFAHAEPPTIPRAVSASSTLAPPDRCTNPERLASQWEPPADPKVRAEIDAVREQMAAATAKWRAGFAKEAVGVAQAAATEADRLGVGALRAEAKLVVGHTLEEAGHYETARDSLREAFFLAEEVELAEVAAAAAERLTFIAGARMEDYDAGLTWARHAKVALRKLGRSEARVLGNEAGILERQGKYAEAIELERRAIEMLQDEEAEDHVLAVLHQRLADALRTVGEADQALHHYGESERLWRDALGDKHPNVAVARQSAGTALSKMGRDDEAVVAYRESLAVLSEALGPDHPHLAAGYTNLGITLRRLGKLDEARAAMERALELTVKAYGPDHRKVAHCRDALGRVLTVGGLGDQAIAEHQAALKIYDKALDEGHPDFVLVWFNIGAAHHAMDRAEESLAAYRTAYDLAEKSLPEDDALRADARATYGRALQRAGRNDEAVPLLERGLKGMEGAKGYDAEIVDWRYSLAQALWPKTAQRERALGLARQAREGADEELRAEIDGWIAERVGD